MLFLKRSEGDYFFFPNSNSKSRWAAGVVHASGTNFQLLFGFASTVPIFSISSIR